MTPKLFSNLIDDFHERGIPLLTTRGASLKRLPTKANVITGMRRAGKTCFCYQTMQDLLAQGIAKERILYLNFEDDRLLPFQTVDFQLIRGGGPYFINALEVWLVYQNKLNLPKRSTQARRRPRTGDVPVP